jgi:hypothetical protein
MAHLLTSLEMAIKYFQRQLARRVTCAWRHFLGLKMTYTMLRESYVVKRTDSQSICKNMNSEESQLVLLGSSSANLSPTKSEL